MIRDDPALAIVQARMSSSRLPGKTLADVEGEPMLALLLARLAGAREVGRVLVATSDEARDDPIAALAASLGFAAIRGPRDDVLARFLIAIDEHGDGGPVVRITGDCPLIDPAIVDATIARFRERPRCAYASNIEPRTFPDGLDVEVVDPGALRQIAAEALDPADREHVTSAIRSSPSRFPSASLTGEPDLGALRWTVDDAADLSFVREVVRRLGPGRHTAGLEAILAAVRSAPSLAGPDGLRG